MGEGKQYFMLNFDLIHTLSQLPNDKAGELFKHILSFVHDQEPVTEDIVINMAFEPIKQGLIEEFEKKRSFRMKCSDAGKKSAELRQKKKPQKKQGTSTDLKEPQGTLKFDYQEILDVFNSVCTDLPHVTLTDQRIKLIDAILKKYSLEQIGEVFRKTKESDYLNGKIRKWRANLNWILNPNNFIKVLEGNYANIYASSSTAGSIEVQLKEAHDTVSRYYK